MILGTDGETPTPLKAKKRLRKQVQAEVQSCFLHLTQFQAEAGQEENDGHGIVTSEQSLPALSEIGLRDCSRGSRNPNPRCARASIRTL